MRLRVLLIVLLAAVLSLSSCSLFGSSGKTTWRGTVGQGEVRAEVGGATVVFPDGVAPAGTKASVELKPRDDSSPEHTVSASDVVEVSLDGGLQPAAPVTISIPVDVVGADKATVAEEYLLFGSSQAGDAEESFFTGSFDAASGTYSMTVDHFSRFMVLGVDIGEVLAEVRTGIMQGIGLELPAPECVGAPATVGRTSYEAGSEQGAYFCLDEDRGSLVVTVYPAVAMPYLITSTPPTDARTAVDEISPATAGVVAMARALGLIDTGREGGLFPGSTVTYRFDGAPQSVQFDLDQYPVLLLMVILAKTLDVIGVASIDELDGLACLADLADSNSALADGIDGQSVGAFSKSFFSCAATFGDLTPFGKVVIAAIGTAPALLVSSVVGLVNEVSGNSHQRFELDVAPAPLRTDQDFLNAELPAGVCWAGDRGWKHAHGIQLNGGTGIALASDGSFENASVIRSSVLGRVDIDGDGNDEVVMSLLCSGSLPETCCAGRSSTMITVAVFTVEGGHTLKQIAPSLMGGSSGPGDRYGPAARKITSAELNGSTVVTSESIIYPEQYTSD
ncbi:MAG: hypothetical protein GX875_10725, partial [Propionibacterium sp.]|nr:hypothetical protein [Propionibacterium sp.]